jgi:hypothetical protein
VGKNAARSSDEVTFGKHAGESDFHEFRLEVSEAKLTLNGSTS